jgi:GT2 family glycosyltransferase
MHSQAALRTSVIVPCFAPLDHVETALSSLSVARPHEVILVDDGSASPELLRESLRRWCPTGRYLRQANGGAAMARNVGAVAASGDLLRFLDADDLLLAVAAPALDRQEQLLMRHPNISFVHGSALAFRAAGGPCRRRWKDLPVHDEVTPRALFTAMTLMRNRVTTSTVVMRRSTYLEVGGMRPGIDGCEDWDLWLRLAQRGDVGFVSEPVAAYRISPNGLTVKFQADLEQWHSSHARVVQDVVRDSRERSRALARVSIATAEVAVYRSAMLREGQGYLLLGLADALRLMDGPLVVRGARLQARLLAAHVARRLISPVKSAARARVRALIRMAVDLYARSGRPLVGTFTRCGKNKPASACVRCTDLISPCKDHH